MPTTADGYRYPNPGDAASALDTDIANLATDVDNANRRGTLAARPLASAVFPGTRYTVTSGASVGQVSICAPDPGAGGANAWWPLATEWHTHAEAALVGCMMSFNPSQNVPVGAYRPTWNYTWFDTGFHSGTDDFLVAPSAGLYECSGIAQWASSTTAKRSASIFCPGVSNPRAEMWIPATAAAEPTAQQTAVIAPAIYRLSAGDHIVMEVNHNLAAGTLALFGKDVLSGATMIYVKRIGP